MDKVRDRTYLALDNIQVDTFRFNCFTAEEGIDLLKQKSDIDLIICDFEKEFLNGFKLFNYFKKANIQIPLILYTDENIHNLKEFDGFNILNPKNMCISPSVEQRMFQNHIRGILNPEKTFELVDKMENEFDCVRIIYFLRFNKSLCDVYLKISESKFVKIINEGDNYTRKFIEKFTDKKVKFLFIKKEVYENFCVNVLKTPFLIFREDSETLDKEEVHSTTVEVIHNLIDYIGISPMVISLVDQVVEKIGNDLDRKEDLSKLLLQMRDKRDYLYDHSYLVAYLSCAICMEMNWDSESTRKKLTMTAMLHDIGIEDADMALAIELNLPSVTSYSKEQIDNFKKHPTKNAEMVRKSSRLPPNIDEIIEKHHENPKMTGFPRGLNATSITKISGIFNLAHNFINELYGHDFNAEKIPMILKKIEKEYDKGNYRNAVAALLAIMKKSNKPSS